METEKQGEEILEEVDVEEYGKAGRSVPLARRYKIRIDKEQKVVEQPVVSRALHSKPRRKDSRAVPTFAARTRERERNQSGRPSGPEGARR